MSSRPKALIIGCGRIGAGMSGKESGPISHAAILAESKVFDLSLYDKSPIVAQKASSVFNAPILNEVSQDVLSQFSLVVVSTDTPSHSEYLQQLVGAGVSIILCEKPLCENCSDLDEISMAYAEGKSRILVNYTRRFQPAYIQLQSKVRRFLEDQSLRACTIRYQRGFLNNASHAIDLLQFLLGWKIASAAPVVTHSAADEFAEDPTISCCFDWDDAFISIVGLPYVQFSLFEVDLFFDRDAVRIRDRGELVELHSSAEPEDYYAPLKVMSVEDRSVNDSFQNLYKYVESMVNDVAVSDNFDEVLSMTRWLLKVLNSTRI